MKADYRAIASSRKSRRHGSGAFVAELPLVLWVLFLLLTVPLLNLATVGLRYGFFMNAAREAVHEASRAKSFQVDISPVEKSAVHRAQDEAITATGMFSEIRLDSVTTNIVITDLTTKAVTRRNLPLSQPANTSLYLYQIESVLGGRVSPLITFNSGVLGHIPGFTEDVPVSVVAREFCEYPEGLTR